MIGYPHDMHLGLCYQRRILIGPVRRSHVYDAGAGNASGFLRFFRLSAAVGRGSQFGRLACIMASKSTFKYFYNDKDSEVPGVRRGSWGIDGGSGER